MGAGLKHAGLVCASVSLVVQKGFVSGDAKNHAVTMPVPAASVRCGVAHESSSPGGILQHLRVRADSI